MARYSGKKCRLLTMLWLTAFFFLVEIIVGYISNSMSLIADSFHMLSDVAALVVAFLSVKVITPKYHPPCPSKKLKTKSFIFLYSKNKIIKKKT